MERNKGFFAERESHMKRFLRGAFALLLGLALLAGLLPAAALAEESEELSQLVAGLEPAAAAMNSYDPAKPLPALTGDQARDTANIAVSQLGYSGANGTVYGAWWGKQAGWDGFVNEAWCAMFVCWCAGQAGAGMGQAYDASSAMVKYLYEFLQDKATLDTACTGTPKPGDFIFFVDGAGALAHVAVVTAYDSGSKQITLVGGNQGPEPGGSVTQGTVGWYKGAPWGGTRTVAACGRPNYENSNPARLSGSLRPAGGGSASVSLYPAATADSAILDGSARAADRQEGNSFRFNELERKDWKLYLQAEGCLPRILEVKLREDTTLDGLRLWKLGDPDFDGERSALDVLNLQLYVGSHAGCLNELDEQELEAALQAADVDFDGEVGALDVLNLQLYIGSRSGTLAAALG